MPKRGESRKQYYRKWVFGHPPPRKKSDVPPYAYGAPEISERRSSGSGGQSRPRYGHHDEMASDAKDFHLHEAQASPEPTEELYQMVLKGRVDWRDVKQIRRCAKTLQRLYICGAIQTDRTIAQLTSALKITHLQQLYFTHITISPMMAPVLTEILENSHLHLLYLTSNYIDHESLVILTQALKTNATLQQLYVCHNEMDSADVKEFANVLEQNSTLKRLCLNHNEIDSKGVMHLAAALERNSTLQFLDLASNIIEASGLRALTELLAYPILMTTHQHQNPRHSWGVVRLAQALRCNSSLLRLTLRGNYIDSHGQMLLLEGLRYNSTLRELDLTENKRRHKFLPVSAKHLKSIVQMPKFHYQSVRSVAKTLISLSEVSAALQEIVPLCEEWNTLKMQKAVPAFHEKFVNLFSDKLEELSSFQKSFFSDRDMKQQLDKLSSRQKSVFSTQEMQQQMDAPLTTSSIAQQILLIFSIKQGFEEWIENHEACHSHIEVLKGFHERLIDFEEKCDECEFKLKKAVRKHRISHRNRARAEKQIAQLREEISSLEREVESCVHGISAYPEEVHASYLLQAQEILMVDSDASGNDPVADMKSKLMHCGKFFRRDFNSDYADPIALNKTQTILKALSKRDCNQEVILKRLPFREDSQQDMAWNELNHLLSLQNSPFIIELHGVFIQEAGTELILEMPFYSNGNLMHWLKKQEYDTTTGHNAAELRRAETQRYEHEIIHMFLQIVQAVEEIHSLGVEHCDLKPEHILFVGDASPVRVKLIDFGIGKDSLDISFSTTMKMVNGVQTQRTARYAAPERKYENQDIIPIGGSWDMYSLGVLLYEMLCAPNDASRLDYLSDTNIDARDALLARSGMLNEWSFNLVISLLSKKPQERPSASEVCLLLKQKIYDSQREMLYRIEKRRSNSWRRLLASVQSSTTTQVKHMEIRRSHLLYDTINYFAKLKTAEDLLCNHIFQYTGESGHGSGVFRDLCTLLVEQLQVDGDCISIFESNSSGGWDFFSPVDDVGMKKQMQGLGRLVFYCVAKNMTLRLRLSPLVYCVLVDQVPVTTTGWLDILRPYDSSISRIESYLRSASKYEREMAIEQVEEKKNHLMGSEHRMSNMKQFCIGFKSCMKEDERDKLCNLSWKDAQLLCAGSEEISSGTVLRVVEESLLEECWRKHGRTVQWFKEWILDQDSDGLRLFLGFCTGLNTLPLNLQGFQIRVLPCPQYVRSATCFKELRIGTKCRSQASFFRMMNHVMENYTIEGQRHLEH